MPSNDDVFFMSCMLNNIKLYIKTMISCWNVATFHIHLQVTTIPNKVSILAQDSSIFVDTCYSEL